MPISIHIDRAIIELNKGNIIAIPTDTIYGLAADANNPEAIKKLNKIKKRDESKYYIVQIDSIKNIHNIVDNLSLNELNILKKYWPGEITFIFNKSQSCTYSFLEETIGVRIPNHPITLNLLKCYSKALAVTSLNTAGEPAILDYKKIPQELNSQIAYIIPSISKTSNTASTIVNMTSTPPSIIRQGAVQFK